MNYLRAYALWSPSLINYRNIVTYQLFVNVCTMSKLVKLLHRQFVVPWNELKKTVLHFKANDGGYFPRTRGFLVQWARFNEPKYGTHVGTDELGNKYYENNRFFVARNRWVDYNQDTWEKKWDFNASQVAPEWHRWLHYMTDDPPTKVPPTQRPFLVKYSPNMTGKKECYVPYTTTRPKIEAWKPQ